MGYQQLFRYFKNPGTPVEFLHTPLHNPAVPPQFGVLRHHPHSEPTVTFSVEKVYNL